MTPSLPIPTDNIFKFACLFGLTLIVVSIFSFVQTYTSSLDQKVKYSEVVIALESKAPRSKAEDELLELNRKLISIAGENQDAVSKLITWVLAVGTLLSAFGAHQWYFKIQVRDDKLARLQIEKLEVELANLRAEGAPAAIPSPGGSSEMVEG